MRKKTAAFIFGILLSTAVCWAGEDPDLEGPIVRIDYTKSIILVRNDLENKIGKRDYRVKVKQGMIGGYMKDDWIKVWLMADRREAAHIELVRR